LQFCPPDAQFVCSVSICFEAARVCCKS
jgi:hypothetical protein